MMSVWDSGLSRRHNDCRVHQNRTRRLGVAPLPLTPSPPTMSSASLLPHFLQPLVASTSSLSEGPIDASFRHSETLGNANAHCLWWPNTTEEPSTVLLFIPGNAVSCLRYSPMPLKFLCIRRKSGLGWILYSISQAYPRLFKQLYRNSCAFYAWPFSQSRPYGSCIL